MTILFARTFRHWIDNPGQTNLANCCIDLLISNSVGTMTGKVVYLQGAILQTATLNDIRFYDATGLELPYWIETPITTPARVWVTLSLPAAGAWLYINCGNGSCTGASSIAAVFPFSDDFSTLNTARWTVNPLRGTVAVANGRLVLTPGSSTYSGAGVVAIAPLPAGDYSIVARVQRNGVYGVGEIGLLVGLTPKESRDDAYYGNWQRRYDVALYAHGGDGHCLSTNAPGGFVAYGNAPAFAGVWTRMAVEVKQVVGPIVGTVLYESTGAVYTVTVNNSTVLPVLYPTIHYGEYGQYGVASYVDWFFVRPLPAVAPTHGPTEEVFKKVAGPSRRADYSCFRVVKEHEVLAPTTSLVETGILLRLDRRAWRDRDDLIGLEGACRADFADVRFLSWTGRELRWGIVSIAGSVATVAIFMDSLPVQGGFITVFAGQAGLSLPPMIVGVAIAVTHGRTRRCNVGGFSASRPRQYIPVPKIRLRPDRPTFTLPAGVTAIASVQDQEMVTWIVNGNLVVPAGATLTTATRCKGLRLIVLGNLTVGGTISMTARGAVAVGKDVHARGISWLPPPSHIQQTPVCDDYAVFARVDTGLVERVYLNVYRPCGRIVDDLKPYLTIPAIGGAGGIVPRNITAQYCGYPGATGIDGQSGGGGSGHAGLGQAGDGAAGTAFSGGAAGGGLLCGQYLTQKGYSGSPNGGPGGNGRYYSGYYSGDPYIYWGGGAGNPGGTGYNNVRGQDGTGGLFIGVAFGAIAILAGGVVEARGMDGQSTGYRGSGGSSGGGCALAIFGTTFANNGTISAAGGASIGGAGAGGAGTTRVWKMEAL